MNKIRDQRAFASGLFFLGLAVIFFVLASGYSLGSAAAMGPGYFPIMVSLALGLVGLLVIGGSLAPSARPQALARWDLKSLVWITGSVFLFAFLLYSLGFIIAAAAQVLLASKASKDFGWRGAVVSAFVIVSASIVIFSWGLGVQLPLLPDIYD